MDYTQTNLGTAFETSVLFETKAGNSLTWRNITGKIEKMEWFSGKLILMLILISELRGKIGCYVCSCHVASWSILNWWFLRGRGMKTSAQCSWPLYLHIICESDDLFFTTLTVHLCTPDWLQGLLGALLWGVTKHYNSLCSGNPLRSPGYHLPKVRV